MHQDWYNATLKLLLSLLNSDSDTIAYNGFAALLDDEQVQQLLRYDSVISIFEDKGQSVILQVAGHLRKGYLQRVLTDEGF
ncbi:hypothetical protein Fmac_016023 [Flemingia macrophylla]|uniref:Inhibitor I9 domain-containing protein n=1 Tax=Flemingia macrophylla TaxID=520843 RepID=A0ABD1MG90_9FABA